MYYKHYFGCKIRAIWPKDGQQVDLIPDFLSDHIACQFGSGPTYEKDVEVDFHDSDVTIYLHLIHPADLTVSQFEQYSEMVNGERFAESVVYLFELHVDIFDLIGRGLAINRNDPDGKYADKYAARNTTVIRQIPEYVPVEQQQRVITEAPKERSSLKESASPTKQKAEQKHNHEPSPDLHVCRVFNVEPFEGGIRRVCRECNKAVIEYNRGYTTKPIGVPMKKQLGRPKKGHEKKEDFSQENIEMIERIFTPPSE